MVILVKIENRLSKSATIINIIYLYSEQNDTSENENDHFDLDHFDQIADFFLISYLN